MKGIASLSFIEMFETEVDLMTLKSIRVISEGEVVIYDKGINEKVLELISPKAEIISVDLMDGKSAVFRICKTIEDRVKENKKIVRISNSQNCPFRELGWEKRFNVQVNILPSLKPYLSLPALNKVSITRRGHNTSFIVIKEKTEGGKLKSILKIFNNTPLSIVLLNNYSLLPEVIRLLKGNNKEKLPLAVIPTFSSEKTEWIIGTVENIHEKLVFEYFIKEPIIIIGEVINTIKKVPVKEVVHQDNIF